MKLWKFVTQHSSYFVSALDALLGLCVGVYGSVLVAKAGRSPLLGLHYWNFLLLAMLAILGLKQKLLNEVAKIAAEETKDVVKRFQERRQRAIKKFLEVAACSLARSNPGSEQKIRACCHVYNPKLKELQPHQTWSKHFCTDFDSCIPCDGEEAKKFVIVKAFKKRDVVREDLAPEQRASEKIPIWDKISSVMACPLRDFSNPNCEPIGTISFDSSLPLAEAHLDSEDDDESERIKEICRVYASSIYDLLKD